jgi:hypothetical protein
MPEIPLHTELDAVGGCRLVHEAAVLFHKLARKPKLPPKPPFVKYAAPTCLDPWTAYAVENAAPTGCKLTHEEGVPTHKLATSTPAAFVEPTWLIPDAPFILEFVVPAGWRLVVVLVVKFQICPLSVEEGNKKLP